MLRRGDQIDADDIETINGPRCAKLYGFSVHAGVGVPAQARDRLERLCRYAARPPLAMSRLSQMDDGRLLYKLKRAWRDGTTHIVFERTELLERLVALVPPPRFNIVRYHGCLAPCASWRDVIVADRAEPPGPPPISSKCACTHDHDAAEEVPVPAHMRERRLAWSDLIRRVFAVDVLKCDCGGRMRLIATIEEPRVVRAILESLGLRARPPPLTPARSPDLDLLNQDLEFDPDRVCEEVFS